ncbi:hypothetical protein COBT_003118 [Conglomerata obtusa]
MDEYVIFEAYDGYRKIVSYGSEVNYKRYGTVLISKELEVNSWYDLNYKLFSTILDDESINKRCKICVYNCCSGDGSCKGASKLDDAVVYECCYKTQENAASGTYIDIINNNERINKNAHKNNDDSLNENEHRKNLKDFNENINKNLTNEINAKEDINQIKNFTNHKNAKTLSKYAKKKDAKNTKLFRLKKITPFLLLEIYQAKCNKSINYMTLSCLSYLQLYVSPNTLVFDDIKGLLLYSLLYRTKSITAYKKEHSKFDILKYAPEKEIFYLSENCEENFDTVFIAGKIYNSFMWKKFVGNLVLIYVFVREEAIIIFDSLMKDPDFIDVSLIDFFEREWQVYENVRPLMNYNLRGGYIIKATRVY